ncbi:hypothetical protein O3Q51_15900 [Cryomorphaceae bacterium 1068]|nr:hypothetical protein [Cryomorphaceae bacterium 1068]
MIRPKSFYRIVTSSDLRLRSESYREQPTGKTVFERLLDYLPSFGEIASLRVSALGSFHLRVSDETIESISFVSSVDPTEEDGVENTS